ncbi:MAG: hypothetical protein PHP50_06835 [Lachnospiraceae bacterium]|nr:hypothetical protein [Lachnospiraceae bacterium]
MDIDYTVSFWLENAPTDGADYTVSTRTGETTQTYSLNTATKEAPAVFISQRLGGGAALKNAYNISITVSGNHKAIPVYVLVRTTDTAIVDSTLKVKMTLTNVTVPEQFIDSSEFDIPAAVSGGTETEQLAAMDKLAGLTYEIRTVGRVLATEDLTQVIKLSWDATKLDIDRNDTTYLAWLEEEKKTNPGISGPLTENVNGVTWNYITLEVMPYSSEEIIFYKKNGLQLNSITLAALNGYVKAEKAVTDTKE